MARRLSLVAAVLACGIVACGDVANSGDGSGSFGTTGEPECPDEDRQRAEPPWVDFAFDGGLGCVLDGEGRVGCLPDFSDASGDYACTLGRALDFTNGGLCLALADGGARCFNLQVAEEISAGSADEPRLIDRVATGGSGSFFCAVDSEGKAECRGLMAGGLVGAYSWNAPDPESRFTDVVAGQDHACGLGLDGRIGCWGEGSIIGTNPDESGVNHITGQGMPPQGEHIALAATVDSTCAVAADGGVFCWGAVFNGAEGEAPLPEVEGGYVDVAVDGPRVCGLLGDGSVRCTEDVAFLEREPGDLMNLQLSGFNACGMTSEGAVECWGQNPPDFSLGG